MALVYDLYPKSWGCPRPVSLLCEECGRSDIASPPYKAPYCRHCGSTRLILAPEAPSVVDYRDGATP